MKRKRFTDTDAWKIILTLIEIALIAAFVYGCIWIYRSFGFAEALAEDDWTYKGYVICMPDDHVHVRSGPGKKSGEIGWLEPGDMILLDGEEKNGFIHCVDLSFEQSEGWIHSGYVVYDPPIRMDAEYTVVAKKRLWARKYVNGRKTRALKPMAIITVYYWSDEWCVTNKGYVQSEWLEYGGY